MRSHRNNFDLIRLLAALLVIYGHQLQLNGLRVPLPLGVPISKTGLDLFFCISGYLVTDSWDRAPRLAEFLGKRSLRIFPGLAAVVLVSAFALGPTVTDWSFLGYMRSGETWRYLLNIVLFAEQTLPGVFTDNTEQAVNGSLWSLAPEFFCYLTVPCLALLPRLLRIAALLSLTGACAITGTYLIDSNPDAVIPLFHVDLRFVLVEACFFFSGSFLRVLDRGRDEIYRTDLALIVCIGIAVTVQSYGYLGLLLQWFGLSYITICFGRAATPVLCRASRFGDLSYGLYLYAYPVQQLLTGRFPHHVFPLVLLTTAALAFISWHLVEQPALRLKHGLMKRLATRPRVA